MKDRIAGTLWRPRATMTKVCARPTWAAVWGLALGVWVICAAALLSTNVGQQALVDERVRVIEEFGGQVSDLAYGRWQAEPPWWVYLTSGSRLLLTPVVTLIVAGGLLALAGFAGARATFRQSLAVSVHAGIVLVLGQVVAMPLHYVRESLTSPLNLAAVLPLLEEGTWPARVLGTVDVFVVWWLALLAVGLSVLTGRRATRYFGWAGGLYLGFSVVVALTLAVVGGGE
ncbi:MAG: YIP1 family protein [Acidobacteriota bacterium]